MYTAYLDGTCILDAKHEILLENPTLELADNEAGSFTFTIYKNNPGYSLIKMLTGIVTVKWDDEVLFKGRIISAEKSFEKALTVECEGELAYLADSIQRPAEYHELTVYAYVAKLVELHNAQVGADKQFEVGAVTVTDSNDSLYRYTNWESTLDVFNSDLLDSLGGHLRIRYDGSHRYLDYLADYPRLSGQKIEFGENLLTYTESNSALELATVCIPLGARQEESSIEALEERLTVKAVNNNKDYIELSKAVQTYGRITKTVIWDGVNTPSILLAKGQKWLQDNQYEDLELSLSAVDLADFGVDTDHLRILDRIHCTSVPHGMDHEFPLTSLSISLLDPTQNIYTLGTKLKTFSKSTGRAQKSVQTQLDNSPSKSNVLKQALDNATQLITMVGKDGHVIFSPSVSEPNELYITDYDNLEDAQRCWRWNLNGLGYSSNGKDGPFDLAITMDGTIAGRFIAAGTIGADQIDVSYTSTQEKKWQDELGNNYWTSGTVETKIQNSADNVLLSAEQKMDSKLGQYYTKSQIDVTVDGINSTVSKKKMDSKLGQYYTKSQIDVTVDGINSTVSKKVGSSEIISKINQSAEGIKISGDKVGQYYTKSQIDVTVDGINSTVSKKVGSSEIISKINQSAEGIKISGDKVDVDASTFRVQATKLSWKSTYSEMSESGILKATSVDLSGSLKAGGTGYWVKLDPLGKLTGGYGNSTYGYIEYSAVYTDGSHGIIESANIIELDTYCLATKRSTTPGSATQGGTGYQDFIYQIDDLGEGRIRWWTTTLHFINGLMCSSL